LPCFISETTVSQIPFSFLLIQYNPYCLQALKFPPPSPFHRKIKRGQQCMLLPGSETLLWVLLTSIITLADFLVSS